MSAHTPGPWKWGDDYKGLYGAGPDNDVLSTAYYENMWLSYKSNEAEREANARLIAAAPELLEALKAMQRQLRRTGASLWTNEQAEADLMACAAIAKATGEQA